MNFGEAIAALKDGEKVQRDGWNGKGMYLVMVVECYDFAADSLAVFKDIQRDVGKQSKVVMVIPTDPYIVMRTAQGTAQPGWLASQADMLADDWNIVTK